MLEGGRTERVGDDLDEVLQVGQDGAAHENRNLLHDLDLGGTVRMQLSSKAVKLEFTRDTGFFCQIFV